ncbi:MAG: sulfotransferase [Phycisphaerales bacterium]
MSSDPIRDLLKSARQAMASGNLRQAGMSAREAVARAPEHARANLVLGIILREMGDFPTAVEHLQKAAAAAPEDVEIQFNLANTLHSNPRRLEEAKPIYEKCVELAPDSVPAHAALAKLYEELSELDEARRVATRALELSPDHPASLLVVALVDMRQDKLEEARAGFERLILAEGGALVSKLPPVTRSTAFNRYAATLDRLGEYNEAASFFDRAQRVRWSCPDARNVRPNQPLRVLEDSKRAVTPELLRAWSEERHDDGVTDPVFLVGFPRSGTTLTEQILAAHPGVVTLDESSPLAEVLPKIAARTSAGTYPMALPKIRSDFVSELRALYAQGAEKRLDAAGAGPQGDRVLIDKLPLTIMHLPAVVRIFPNARVIVALRDPRDACVSAFTQLMQPNNAMSHLRSVGSAAPFYAQVMGRWLEIRDTLPIPWIESRYEDLVTDTEASARRLVEFLGLAWDDEVMRYREKIEGKSISTPSYEAVSRPVSTASVGRWRNYASQFEGVGDVLAPFLDAFGYER